ncbi:MAG: hypothetical protein WC565_10145 [Parcubacteria group bacterium]
MLKLFTVCVSMDVDFSVLAETREEVEAALKNTDLYDWVDVNYDVTVVDSKADPLKEGSVDSCVIQDGKQNSLCDLASFELENPDWKERLYAVRCETERKARNLWLPGIPQ